MIKGLSESDEKGFLFLISVNDPLFENQRVGLEIPEPNMRRVRFSQLGIHQTPILMVVDHNGRIIEIRDGALSRRTELSILERFGISENDSRYLNLLDFTAALNDQQARVIDIRARHERETQQIEGSINIPLDELSVRAVNEINHETLVVLFGNTERNLEDAFEILRAEGFSEIKMYRE